MDYRQSPCSAPARSNSGLLEHKAMDAEASAGFSTLAATVFRIDLHGVGRASGLVQRGIGFSAKGEVNRREFGVEHQLADIDALGSY